MAGPFEKAMHEAMVATNVPIRRLKRLGTEASTEDVAEKGARAIAAVVDALMEFARKMDRVDLGH